MLWLDRLLTALGVDRRGLLALTRMFLLMDLRGQHYTKATGTRPQHVVSPLFWVVGQCLTASAVTSLVLFARVSVWFYSFVSLTLSMLALATTVLVEFHEIVLDPRDLEVLGHRPLTPRTYAGARFANLLFYVALMYLTLNLFPLIVGAGLRDAGPWYAPAYLVASLAGNLAVVALVIVLLSCAGNSSDLEKWKEILAWTQIILILVVGYGAQLLLRDESHGFELWGAFPPAWVAYLPPAWLAWFVDEAAAGATESTLFHGLLLVGVAGAAMIGTLWRVAQLHRTMQPQVTVSRERPMPRQRIGGLTGRLADLLTRGAEERAGFWLGNAFLARDGNLKMRCLLPVSSVVAAVILGICTSQFESPLRPHEPRVVLLPILAVYLVALSVPPMVYNLCFMADHEASWLLAAAPLERPAGVALGACKAVWLRMVTPLCVLLGTVAFAAWRDPLAAVLHAGLAWALSWPMALAALWLAVPDQPFSLPHVRGGSLGPIALPMALLSSVAMILGGLHYLFAASPLFWLGLGLACVAAVAPLTRLVDARFRQLIREAP